VDGRAVQDADMRVGSLSLLWDPAKVNAISLSRNLLASMTSGYNEFKTGVG
jgi:hypothetical protein